MQLKSNTFLIRNFVRGKDRTSLEGLLYQATVEDWANDLHAGTDGGGRRIKLGFSGDVTPGPAWKGGEVVLPIPGGEWCLAGPTPNHSPQELLQGAGHASPPVRRAKNGR